MKRSSTDQRLLDALLADLSPEERNDPALVAALAESVAARSRWNIAPAEHDRIVGRIRTRIASLDTDPSPPSLMKYFLSSILGFGAAAALFFGIVAYRAPESSTTIALNDTAPAKSGVTFEKPQAFGKLPALNQNGVGGMGGDLAAPHATTNATESAPNAPAPAPNAPAATTSQTDAVRGSTPSSGSAQGSLGTAGIVAAPDRMMPYPEEYLPPREVITYTGKDLPAAPAELPVYKYDSSGVAADLGRLRGNLGAIMPKNIGDAEIVRMSFAETKAKGYSFDIDLLAPSLNFYRPMPVRTMPMPTPGITEPAMPAPVQGAKLPDADAISIAQAFAREYGISTEGLDGPIVDDSWKRWAYPMADAAEGMRAPEPMYDNPYTSVKWTRTLDGYPLLTWDGSPEGALTVSINNAERAVESGYGQLPTALAASKYPTIDFAAAKAQMAKGGVNRYVMPALEDPAQEKKRPVTTIALTEVKLGYIVKNQTMDDRGRWQNYLVPVYIFTGTQKDPYSPQPWPTSVVVPAIQSDFFNDAPNPYMYEQKGGVMMDAVPPAAPTPPAPPVAPKG